MASAPRTRVLAAAAAVALAALAAVASAQSGQAGPVLVMPFDNLSGQGRIYWLQEAAAILLADDLNASGVRAITRTERVHAFEQLHLPPAGSLTHATAIKVAQLVGAAEVVLGTLDLEGTDLTMKARSIRLDAGRIQPEVIERGPLTDLFEVSARVARRLSRAAPAGPPASSGAAGRHPPLEAFESFVKGLVAEAPASRIAHLESALKLHPGYDRARLALWEVRTETGDHARALAAALAVPAASSLSRRARFAAGLSRLHLKQYDEAFALLKALLDDEAAAPLYNNLGLIQIRRGWTPQTGTPAYYFNKAIQADGADPDYYFNLGYAYWLDKDPQASIYWLREAVRRDPADGDAHFVLGAALLAGGNAVEAAREKELARNLSSTYAEWERRPAAATELVPRGLERLKSNLQTPRALRMDSGIVATAQREQRELGAFHLDRGRRLFEEEKDREAIVELRRALFLSPYEPEPHLLLGRIYLRGGRLQDAIDAFKIAVWSDETAAGRAALAEAHLLNHDPEAARSEVARALVLDPGSPEARRLLEKLAASPAR